MIDAAHTFDLPPLEIFAGGALGLLELGIGNYREAARILHRAQAIARQGGCLDPVTVPCGADLVEALVRDRRRGEAQTVLESEAQLAATAGSAWAFAVVARSRALLARSADDADRWFLEAVELNPPIVAFELARTKLAWGENLRRRRDISASRELLNAALITFENLGSRPWADRARAELRASGQQVSRPGGSQALESLTSQELQCALAVADGKTNREVASTLFLSSKTVDYHLRKVYAKLNITSRSQLVSIVKSLQVAV